MLCVTGGRQAAPFLTTQCLPKTRFKPQSAGPANALILLNWQAHSNHTRAVNMQMYSAVFWSSLFAPLGLLTTPDAEVTCSSWWYYPRGTKTVESIKPLLVSHSIPSEASVWAFSYGPLILCAEANAAQLRSFKLDGSKFSGFMYTSRKNQYSVAFAPNQIWIHASSDMR